MCEIVQKFGATATDDAISNQEIKIRIAAAMSSLTNLKPIGRDRNVSMDVRMNFAESIDNTSLPVWM